MTVLTLWKHDDAIMVLAHKDGTIAADYSLLSARSKWQHTWNVRQGVVSIADTLNQGIWQWRLYEIDGDFEAVANHLQGVVTDFALYRKRDFMGVVNYGYKLPEAVGREWFAAAESV